MCTLWTLLLNLSIPDVPFPVLLSTLIRSRFQAKSATLLIPIDFSFLFAVEELYGTRYQSGSFSLIMWGVAFTACVVFYFYVFLFSAFFFFLLIHTRIFCSWPKPDSSQSTKLPGCRYNVSSLSMREGSNGLRNAPNRKIWEKSEFVIEGRSARPNSNRQRTHFILCFSFLHAFIACLCNPEELCTKLRSL